MFKLATFGIISCVILLLIGFQSASASDLAGRLRLGAIGGMGMCEQRDLNGTIDDAEDFWTPWNVDWGDTELRRVLEVGAYAEYVVSENWVVGAEFLRLSSSGGYDWYDGWSSGAVGMTDVDMGYNATGYLISAYGVYRLPLGDSPAALRLGAGAGYLLGAQFKMDFSAYQEGQFWPGTPESTAVYQTDLRANGSTLALTGLVGAEYEMTGHFLLSANIAYRVASIAELEVDDFRKTVNGLPSQSWDIEEGKILRWDSENMSFSTDEGDLVGLDFSGLHFTLMVAYVF